MSKENKIFDIEERLIDFAVRIIRTAESLPKTKVGNHIAGQLIRCGTSPAPKKLHNSKFLVRYSIFNTCFNQTVKLS
ncbi:MAG: hypothetical protein A3G93_07945 [Nitrospinae bacterium RIFCSPLOWO2_12_FULL_45_22]|nr:MAG: hypothetical protein A3G93_07945 [Nitrospinae bacterium RIFCSPLOWO2_12_FULL_45_22]